MKIELNPAFVRRPQQLIFIIILSSTQYAQAQPFSPSTDDTSNTTAKSWVYIFIGIFVMILVLTFLRLWILVHNFLNSINGVNANSEGVARSRGNGVDQTVIDSFPLIDYVAVKHMRASKSPLECAVCLTEFLDDDTLRLLPGCQHVFHINCINTWLGEHKTCPVCRSNLSDPTVIAGKRLLSPNLESRDVAGSSHMSKQVATSEMGIQTSKGPGHVQSINEGWERYTLMLHEDVMKELKTVQRYRKSKSRQDYTKDGDASWENGKIRMFTNSHSWKRQGNEENNVAMARELPEASESTVHERV